jgi:phosphatidylinositol alpha-1,6-mannosyltransferase
MGEDVSRQGLALLVTRNFPPLVGGMERVNERLLSELAPDWRLGLCGPAGCSASAPAAEWVAEAPLKPLWSFVMRNAWQAFRMARRQRPQLVLAGSGLAAPMAWLAARASGARLAVYLHGLDVIAPSRVYQAVWLPFIRACDLVLVNSRNTGGLATGRGVDGARIHVLHPGVEIPALDPAAGPAFRAEHRFGQAPLLLSVGRFTRRKGLAEFVAQALPQIVAGAPGACLAIIGDEAVDALHGASGSERERIQQAADAAGVGANLRFLGRRTEAELHAAYQAADLHVFPVLDIPGDVEGFGMVAAESAAHGLPTVAFAVGGVPEAVQVDVSGATVPPGDYAGFAAMAVALLTCAPSERERLSTRGREFAASLAWPRFGERLRKLVRAPARRD